MTALMEHSLITFASLSHLLEGSTTNPIMGRPLNQWHSPEDQQFMTETQNVMVKNPKRTLILEEKPENCLENYDRITTILSRFSGIEKIPKEILENAAIRGTKVHDALERWHKDNAEGHNLGNTETDPEIALYVDSFAKWIPGKNPHTIERRFFCDELKITGKIDMIAEEDGGFTIYDYKTSASMHRHYELQVSAYAYLARKVGYDIKKMCIVFLKKDGSKAEEYYVEDKLQIFLSCLQVYRFFGMFLE